MASGVLLEGRIRNHINDDKTSTYFEKRYHGAITFYTKAYDKAGDNHQIKSTIEFILREMAVTSNFETVKSRLARFSLQGFSKLWDCEQPKQSLIFADMRSSFFANPIKGDFLQSTSNDYTKVIVKNEGLNNNNM